VRVSRSTVRPSGEVISTCLASESTRRTTGWPGAWTSSPVDSRELPSTCRALNRKSGKLYFWNQLVLNFSPSISANVTTASE
jgi:hypothetical protein